MSRNAILDYGINSLKQYSKDHGVDTSADMQALNREKIGADEINTDRITTSFKRILLDIRKGIREKKPTSKNATVEALEIIQANIPNQPGKEITADDMTEGIMKFVDQRIPMAPWFRRVTERFIRLVVRVNSGKSKYKQQTFEAYQELDAELDEAEKQD